MSDAYVQVAPDSTGKKIQTYESTVSGNLVEAQAVVLVDSTGVPYAPLTAAFFTPGGRLTTESGVPVSSSNRTAQGTLYYTPYRHNNIFTYSGTAWQAKTFAEISLALTVTSGKNYDVFINSAATTLSLSSAWTTDLARADALGTQDGVTVLDSDHTKLWLGTIRASGSNTTEDSAISGTNIGGRRFVWNVYNQVRRHITAVDNTGSWSYTSATIRQANGNTGNKVEFVFGEAATIAAFVHVSVGLASNTRNASIGIGQDTTTSLNDKSSSASNSAASSSTLTMMGSFVRSQPIGYHFLSWNETGADATCVFNSGNSTGLIAWIDI